MEPLSGGADLDALAPGAVLGRDGIVRAGPLPRDARPATLVNRLGLAARLYEPLWRRRSMGLLTWGAFGTDRELDRLTAWLAPEDGARLLDVGCGAGFYLRALAGAADGLRLHGLDASEAFLREARRRLDEAAVAATLTLGDAQALPYRDAAFDGVAFGGTPNEVRDRAAAFAEIARVTRPGGRVWLMAAVRAPTPFGRLAQLALRAGGIATPPVEALLAEAEAAGLRPLRVERRPPVALALLRRDGTG
jgi:SAM-dependent methyltransferase